MAPNREASATEAAVAPALLDNEQPTEGAVSWLLSRQTFWVFLVTVLAFVALTLATDTFATEQNLFNVTRNFAFVAIVALGMTAVIITGGIDLSVGSVVDRKSVV